MEELLNGVYITQLQCAFFMTREDSGSNKKSSMNSNTLEAFIVCLVLYL